MNKGMLLLFGMFALGMDAYVMAGILPQVAESFDVSIGAAGQAVSIFTLCYAIAAPIFATAISKANAKHTLMIALAIFTGANIITAMSHQYVLLLLSRGIAGIGAGLYAPLASSVAVQFASDRQRGRALGMILFGMSAGTVIGVPFGIYMASLLDWRWTMWFIVIMGAFGIATMSIGLPAISTNRMPSLRDRLSMFRNKQVAGVMLVTALLSCCSLGLYTYLDQVISSYGYQQSIWFIWMWGLGGILGSLAIGWILDRYRRPHVILLLLILILMVSLLLMDIFHTVVLGLVILLMLWGASGWASIATQQKTLIEIRSDHATISVALLGSVNYLAGSIGTMAFGTMLEHGAAPAAMPYAAGGVLLLAVLLQTATFVKQRRKAALCVHPTNQRGQQNLQ